MRLGSRKLSIAGLVVIVGTLAMLLSACGGASSSGTQQAPKDKQIFKPLDSGANAGDIDNIDPAQIQFGWDYEKAVMLYPQLVTLTDDLKVVDSAASSHEVSSDGLTYTFHLHSGMQWSDGTPIDANSFAYSINRALDPCIASGVAYYLYNIKGATDFNDSKNCTAGADGLTTTGTLIGKSIVVADPQTLKLTIEAPAAYFLAAVTYPTYFDVPKQLIDKFGQAKWVDHLVDNGGLGGSVYKMTRWDHAGHLEFTANDKFSWGKQAIIQHVNYTLYKDVNTLWADYKSGQGDLGYFPAAEINTAKGLKNSTYHESGELAIDYLRVNWATAPFDDVRVRNAFSLAIDRKAIATNVYKGLRFATINMNVKGLPAYNPDLKNAAGDSGDKALTANVAKAQELAKAYATDKCGGDMSKCTAVVYTYANGSSTQLLLAQVLQQEWQTAFPGWPITLSGIDRSQELKTFSKLQLGWDGWGADYPDPQDFLSLLWTKAAQYNQSSVNVPEADALCDKADINPDQTARYQQYQQAEQDWVNQGAFMAYGQRVYTSVTRNSIAGMNVNASGYYSLSNWETSYVKA
jgi:peptide/nickel transport system substrate-binding protein/oligopeptide transport system substrate-binding protein